MARKCRIDSLSKEQLCDLSDSPLASYDQPSEWRKNYGSLERACDAFNVVCGNHLAWMRRLILIFEDRTFPVANVGALRKMHNRWTDFMTPRNPEFEEQKVVHDNIMNARNGLAEHGFTGFSLKIKRARGAVNSDAEKLLQIWERLVRQHSMYVQALKEALGEAEEVVADFKVKAQDLGEWAEYRIRLVNSTWLPDHWPQFKEVREGFLQDDSRKQAIEHVRKTRE